MDNGHELELYESLCWGKGDGRKLLLSTSSFSSSFSSTISSTFSSFSFFSTSLPHELLAMAMEGEGGKVEVGVDGSQERVRVDPNWRVVHRVHPAPPLLQSLVANSSLFRNLLSLKTVLLWCQSIETTILVQSFQIESSLKLSWV